jgi:transcriptional regulator with XRE-family HTH domain
MATRRRSRTDAAQLGREAADLVRRELRAGRLDRNIAGKDVAAAIGLSPAQYSRLERGLTETFPIEHAAMALDAVGLQLAVRVYPGGPPIRDKAQSSLLDRLRACCHVSIRILTEVGLPIPGDPRAWDVVLIGMGWRHRVELETRPRDYQALIRRINLKARDSGEDAGASLILLDSRHNRDFVKLHQAALTASFPVPAAVALAALRAGTDPGAGSVILL